MYGFGPTPAAYIVQREPQVLQPSLIEIIEVPVGTACVYKRGRCVHHKPEVIFALLRLFALGDLEFQVIDGRQSLIRQGGNLPYFIHEPLIFRVVLATIIVQERPYRSDCLASDVKRNQETLYGQRRDG